MVFSYALSWVINVALWGIVLAIIDEGKGYGLEKMPRLVFGLAIGVPTLLEWLAFTFEQKPFLALIIPWFSSIL